MRTTTGLSRRQVGATRRAGNFLDVSRAFVSSGLPERTPGVGMTWAHQMDESPNLDENEDPGAQLGYFLRSGLKKRLLELVGDRWRYSKNLIAQIFCVV
jgi:hypothetical protein